MFTVPGYDEVSPAAKEVFDQLLKTAGKVPNLYATIGSSGNALSSYMAYVHAQVKNTFHGKEREAIYLIVSQFNGCEYCLASHTQSAMKFGWTEDETIQLRSGTFPDAKWQVIYRIIESVIENRGAVQQELLDTFFANGYNQSAMIDLMVLINVMSFTNYVYRLTVIPVDFPPAKPI